MKSAPILLALTLALALPGARPAAAAGGLPDNLVSAEVIGGATQPDGTRLAALLLTLAPGWKTYWRAPGEAGIPPRFNWAGSRNLGGVAFHWPLPQVYEVNGFRIIGYADELVLPFSVRPDRQGDPVTLAAEIELGVCEDVCVPVTLEVRAELPGIARTDPAIRAAMARMPETGAAAGLTSATCRVEPIRDGLRLTAALDIPSPGSGEFAVIEVSDPTIWVSSPKLDRGGGRVTAVADLVPADARPFALNRSDIRITLFGGGRVVEIEGCTG
ncbi:MAG: protein-disulfide reductase DsbD domain-containing protein [Paracoccaceae bacterium]